MNISKSTVQYHLSRKCEENFYRIGRPTLLDEKQHKGLLEFVKNSYNAKMPCTYEQVRDFLYENFDISVNIVSLRSYIARCNDMRTCIGHPLEDTRLFSDTKQIDEYFDQIKELMNFCIPASFILNIDEVGFQDYSDKRDIMCIVPIENVGNEIAIPVNRETKRSIMLAGIYADGSRAKSMIVLTRSTIETELYEFGYTQDKILFDYSKSGFMNTQLFVKWAKNAFSPILHNEDVTLITTVQCYSSLMALAFIYVMNLLNCALSTTFFCRCSHPHTSDQLQFLDLGIFAIHKR